MSVKENSEKIEQIQSRINKLVDEVFVLTNNLATFKVAVAEDLKQVLETVRSIK